MYKKSVVQMRFFKPGSIREPPPLTQKETPMVNSKWQRLLLLGVFLFTTLFPMGAALAASPAGGAQATSCLQTLTEDLGTVLPGSAFSDRISQCPLTGVADRGGLILVTGLADINSGGWRDAGAGSR
jgi:hypothetical protein